MWLSAKLASHELKKIQVAGASRDHFVGEHLVEKTRHFCQQGVLRKLKKFEEKNREILFKKCISVIIYHQSIFKELL